MDQREVVRTGYEEMAGAYASRRSDDGRERALVERLGDTLSPGSRVLDAGCGPGTPGLDALAARHEVVGLDIAREPLRLVRRSVGVAGLTRGDLATLPFEAGSFDALVSLHAVIHVPADEHGAVFREFHRVLRPGGRLLVALGDDEWRGENDDWLDTGTRMAWSFHGRNHNRELLDDAGFTVEAVEAVADEFGGTFAFFRARA